MVRCRPGRRLEGNESQREPPSSWSRHITPANECSSTYSLQPLTCQHRILNPAVDNNTACDPGDSQDVIPYACIAIGTTGLVGGQPSPEPSRTGRLPNPAAVNGFRDDTAYPAEQHPRRPPRKWLVETGVPGDQRTGSVHVSACGERLLSGHQSIFLALVRVHLVNTKKSSERLSRGRYCWKDRVNGTGSASAAAGPQRWRASTGFR